MCKNLNLRRTKNFKKRFKETFIERKHNLLRLRRILSHLNVCGFRIYAIKVVNFIEKQIYGEVGFYFKNFVERNNRTYKVDKRFPLWKLHLGDAMKNLWYMGNVPKEYEELLIKDCFVKSMDELNQ